MPIDRYRPAAPSPPLSAAANKKPIIIELHQADRDKSGNFRPISFLKLSENFRTSGLLSALPAEELKSLMYLLTFVSPNGDCGAAIHQLCSAMRLSALKVRRRMGRLATFHWAGAPLVLEHRRESGLTIYTPHPALIRHEHIAVPEPPEQIQASQVVPREAVIAHSRAKYTTPRDVVEKNILDEMLRYRSPEAIARLQPGGSRQGQILHRETAADSRPGMESTSKESDILVQELQEAGLTDVQARHTIATYDKLRIRRQLQWLPFRNAKNPAGFLLAAIADDYEAPLSMRRKLAISEAVAPEQISPSLPVSGPPSVAPIPNSPPLE